MKILILCTGNACRSIIAERFLRSFDPELEVHSAGVRPAARVHPRAVAVMNEVGIDLNDAVPKSVAQFIHQPFDYVITVCDNARESCPVFSGKVKHRLHIGFDDPTETVGTEDEIWSEFRRVRDEIKRRFYDFYHTTLQDEN